MNKQINKEGSSSIAQMVVNEIPEYAA